jgi:hypothetical protein
MSDMMVIFTRTTDLLAWLMPRCARFPSVYRHTVTQHLADAALGFAEAIHHANSQRDRQRAAYLHTADAHLNTMRMYLLLVMRWGWLSSGQYEHVSRMVSEIGKLLGGWIKQTEGRT